MIQLIIQFLAFLVISIAMIFAYYGQPWHVDIVLDLEVFRSHGIIMLLMIVLYAGYSLLIFFRSQKGLKTTLYWWQLFLIVVIIGFFATWSFGIAIDDNRVIFPTFLGVLKFSVFPFFICLLSFLLGDKVLQKLKVTDPNTFLSLILGFGGVLFLFYILAVFGLYTATILLPIIVGLTVYCGKGWKALFLKWKDEGIESKPESGFSHILKEIFFVVLVFVIVTNLIIALRPVPIGWDEIKAYMNFSHIIGSSGKAISGVTPMVWEVFTGLGFTIKSPTQAFFFSNLGGIIAAVAIYFFTKHFTKRREDLVYFPMLAALFVYVTPIITFQQTADLKVDMGLLAVSLGSLLFCFLGLNNKKRSSQKTLFLLGGLLAGLALGIKMTSVILIAAIGAMACVSLIGIRGFLGYISIVIGIFSALNVWNSLQILVPGEVSLFISVFFILLGAGIFWGGSNKTLPQIRTLLTIGSIFLLGILITISPWLIRNTYQVVKNDQRFHPYYLQAGFSKEAFTPNFKRQNVHKEYREGEEIPKCNFFQNEDLTRFMGSECGISGFMKLPWNVTMQSFQRSQFTEISYIYLLCIVASFLLIIYRRWWYWIFGGIYLGFFIILYTLPGAQIPADDIPKTIPPAGYFDSSETQESYRFKTNISEPFIQDDARLTQQEKTSLGELRKKYQSLSERISNHLANVPLPLGYLILLVVMLAGFSLVYKQIQDKKWVCIFSFSALYGFLWMLSSFGIPWYGIMIYPLSLLFIVMLFEMHEENRWIFTSYLHIIFISLMTISLVFGGLPYVFSQTKTLHFDSFKRGEYVGYDSLFVERPEYTKALIHMNLSSEFHTWESFQEGASTDFKKYGITSQDGSSLSVVEVIAYLGEKIETLEGKQKKEAVRARNSIYEEIIVPNENMASNARILKVGTFFQYFIYQNHNRILDDQILKTFEGSILTAHEDGKDMLKENDITLLLLDLNTPTLDQQTDRRLTQMYENLLKFLKQRGAQIIGTNNTCFELAFSDPGLSESDFLKIASTNYTSILPGREFTSQEEKINTCSMYIESVLQESETHPGRIILSETTPEKYIQPGNFALLKL